MTDGEHVNRPEGLSPLQGLNGLPDNVSPEQIDFLKGLIDSFNSSTAKLRDAYTVLQDKVASLNSRLEDTNRELSVSLDEQERLSNYLTNILESLSSGVLVVDPGGRITLFNRGAETMLGLMAAEVLEKDYREVLGNTVPVELTPLQTLETGRGRSQFEKTLHTSNGEAIPVGCSLSPLRNNAGELVGAVEIFMDLSPIKELEDELARQEKLVALGQMAATMAHKIRNPLGGIAGFAGLLGMELRDNENGKRLVGKITEGVDKLERIVSNLLAYTAILTLETRMTDVADLARDSAAALGSEYPDCTVTVEAVEGPVSAEVDQPLMKTALMNIYRNATEALEFAGQITVTVCDSDSLPDLNGAAGKNCLSQMRKSSKLLKSAATCSMILIRDEGHGFSNEAMSQMFVPFFTTRENGIGLGLAMTRKIVEEHRGEMFIGSIEGGGAVAAILLPQQSAV